MSATTISEKYAKIKPAVLRTPEAFIQIDSEPQLTLASSISYISFGSINGSDDKWLGLCFHAIGPVDLHDNKN
jgi:hypothetical protein